MAPLRSDEQVGRVLDGRYRLIRLLGTGTSAHVYVADDIRLRRRVAVKVLHPSLAADQGFLRRFRAEAQVVASLGHPNIVRVHDWGEEEGSAFLVLELLGGGTLRSLLDTGYLLTPAQVLRLGIEAAGALEHAHRRGLVHRDVKPANLIFDDESRVAVADFGLARAMAESTWTEPAGAVVGTARYAAPEQVLGGSLDARADVYALALVLVEAATGRVPFASDTTLGTLMARVDRPISVGADLGPLTAILEAAGTVDPGDRLEAAALGRELRRLAERVPPPTPLPLVTPSSRRGTERDDAPTEVPARRRVDPSIEGPTLDEPFVIWDADAVDVDDATPTAGLLLGGEPDEPEDPEVTGPDGPEIGDREPGEHPHRRRRIVIAAVAALAVAGGVTGAVVATEPGPSHPVPALAGDTEVTARQALAPLHLHLKVGARTYDATVPAGTVLGQKPATGRLTEGSSVTVTLSAGPKPVSVPVLAGQTQTQATATLSALGLKVGAVTTTSSTSVTKGSVVSSSPDRGTLVPGRSVALVVSSGPPTVPVPSLTGTAAGSYTAAQAALTGVGLLTKENEEYSTTVPAGEVISTYPGPGFPAPNGSTIVVNVSLGPQLITVPSVAGQSVAAATSALSAAGFSVSGVSGNPAATVASTSPAAGAQVRVGTSVQLVTG